MFKKINIFWLSFILIFLNFSAVRAANTNFVTSPTIGTGASINFTPSGSINGANYIFGTSKLDSAGLSYFMGGNVGIGTTNPVATLDVNGTSYFRSTVYLNDPASHTGTSSRLKLAAGTGDSQYIAGGAVNPYWIDYVANSNEGHAFWELSGTTNVSRFIIQGSTGSGLAQTNSIILNPTSGNVGIGTTGPGKLLEVNGQAKFNNFAYGTTPVNTDLLALSTVEYVNGRVNTAGPWTRTAPYIYPTTLTDNVGIGTTAPGRPLAVVSTAGGNTIGLLTNSATVAGGASLDFLTQANRGLGSQVVGLNTNTGELAFYTNAGTTLGLYQNSSGSVGIGTTGPENKLQIASATGQTDTYGYVQTYYTGTGVGANSGYTAKNYSGTSQFMQWTSYGLRIGNRIITNGGTGDVHITSGNDTEVMTILGSNGSVGIGTTAPGVLLDVRGASGGGAINLWTNQAGSSGIQKIFAVGPTGSNVNDGYLQLFDGTVNTVLIGANNARSGNTFFNGGGNVGIGTTAPGAKLEVEHEGASTYGVGTLIKQYAIGNSDGPKIGFYKTMTTPKAWTVGILNGVDVGTFSINEDASPTLGFGTPRLTILPGGNVTVAGSVTATAFIYSSDRNLKQNIATIQSPLEKIMQLRGVTFNWKKDNKPSMGLIAQEVEQVFPELVTGQEGSKAVQYGNLVAPLIEAVKAQQKEIDTLNIRIKILETASRKK